MMTSGGRRAFKPPSGTYDASALDDNSGPIISAQPVLPQHTTMPEVPTLNEVAFQIAILCHSLIIMCFQYINLYHNLWWLPNSYSQDAIDFNAIDYDLFVLIVLILSYRLLHVTVCKVFDRRPGPFSWFSKYSVLGIYGMPVIGTFLLITQNYPIKQWILLLIPLFIYALLFGHSISRRLAYYVPWLAGSQTTPTFYTERFHNLNHACSMNPDHIRNEVSVLKSDFNYRLKTVYFEAVVNVYYSVVIPTAFCRSLYRIDLVWIAYFMLMAAYNAALTCFVQRVPAEYLHTLHKSSIHLGRWRKHDERPLNIPHSIWSELTVWPKGVNVKHSKGLFKAEGMNNSAEPGNAMHAKFYQMFKKPEYISLLLSVLSFAGVCIEFYLLTHYRHWHQQLATAGLLLCNYYTLYVALRDYLVLSRVHHEYKNKK